MHAPRTGDTGKAAVRANEVDRLRDIVARAADGICTIAPDGVVTGWNAAMEEVTGYSLDDVLGAGIAILGARDAAGSEVALARWPESQALFPTEIHVLSKAGEGKWLSCSYGLPTEREGVGDSLVVVARDVTKVREAERLRDEFVATVSHELRAPLAPIKGWASSLLQFGDNLEPEERRAAFQSILRQSQRLERLIVSLLEVSKIEHGMREGAQAEVDLASVVRRVASDFERGSPDRTFTVEGSGPLLALAKELWVEQIVTNLLSNAVKYSPETGPVELMVGQLDGQVEVAVTDHGCGIPAHELERVFDRFHRVVETTTHTGAGLGLYIARQLAEEMRGTLSVQSVPGQGSTFTLHLPAARLVDVRPAAEIVGT